MRTGNAQHEEICCRALSPLVRWVEIDGVVFILDLATETYHALEPEFTPVWKQLVCGLASDSPNADGLARHAAENGWLATACEPQCGGLAGSRTLRVPSTLIRYLPPVPSAWLCMVFAARSLRGAGLAGMYSAFAKALEARPPVQMPAEIAHRVFLRAERYYISQLGQSDCLPRSFALFLFFQIKAGIAVTHYIGVERYPFGAHAWVTDGEQPIFDSAARISRLTPISTFSD